MVRKRLPEISLATVYRNLDVMSQAGLVRRMDYAGAEMRFDGDTSLHCHARCLACGKVVDVDLKMPVPAPSECRKARGFKVTGHRMELLGLCPACAQARRGQGCGREGEMPC